MDLFGPYAPYYDLDYANFDADLPMVQAYAARCGAPILELGCGTGRLLLPLAAEGYRVTGVDNSPAMLAEARRKVAAHSLQDRVTLVQQDMVELDLNQRFNLAYIAINSFAHLSTLDDQLACLRRVRDHLNPEGVLLIDLFNPDMGRILDAHGQLALEKTMTDPRTGHQLMKFHTVSSEPGEQKLHAVFFIDEIDVEGRVQRTIFRFSIRYLFRGELELLLASAGLELETVHGSYELDEYSGDSDRMIAVARRSDGARLGR